MTGEPLEAMDAKLKFDQVAALQQELQDALLHIENGLEYVHRVDGATMPVHSAFLDLTSGIERLLKLTISLVRFTSTGQLPSPRDLMKRYGHDLTLLTQEWVIAASSDAALSAREACRADIEFVDSDPDLRLLLEALTTFAKAGRYSNLDAFLGVDRGTLSDPYAAWSSIERRVLAAHPEFEELLKQGDPRFGYFYPVVGRHVAALIDRYVRAVVRMWTLGPLGHEARRFSGSISSFLFLRDDQLGVPRSARGGANR
jgi:hypothetical protein